jgi:hypothetical protein
MATGGGTLIQPHGFPAFYVSDAHFQASVAALLQKVASARSYLQRCDSEKGKKGHRCSFVVAALATEAGEMVEALIKQYPWVQQINYTSTKELSALKAKHPWIPIQPPTVNLNTAADALRAYKSARLDKVAVVLLVLEKVAKAFANHGKTKAIANLIRSVSRASLQHIRELEVAADAKYAEVPDLIWQPKINAFMRNPAIPDAVHDANREAAREEKKQNQISQMRDEYAKHETRETLRFRENWKHQADLGVPAFRIVPYNKREYVAPYPTLWAAIKNEVETKYSERAYSPSSSSSFSGPTPSVAIASPRSAIAASHPPAPARSFMSRFKTKVAAPSAYMVPSVAAASPRSAMMASMRSAIAASHPPAPAPARSFLSSLQTKVAPSRSRAVGGQTKRKATRL